QGAREFETYQMVTFGMGYTNALSAKSPGGLWELGGGRQRSTGYFEQNPRGERQRAAHGDERTGGAYVESRGKLKEVFALFVAATNKNRNRQRETRHDTAFYIEALKCQIPTLSNL